MKRYIAIAALYAGLSILAYGEARAGTVTFSVAETGQTTATKVYTVPDADIDRLVRAYQSGANTSINGTATRAQVLLYWVTGILTATQQTIQTFETPAPVVPAPISAN